MAEKKIAPNEEPVMAVDRSADREHSLAHSFDDEAVIKEITAAVGPSLVEETASAVHELISFPGMEAPTLDPEATSSIEIFAVHELIQDLFNLVLSDLGFVQLVEAILQALLKSVGAETASMLEFDHGNKQFFFRASLGAGEHDKLESFRVPMGQGIVGHVGESRQAMLIQDVEDNSLQLRSISLATGLSPKTCIAAPIIIADQLYGVVELFNKNDGGHFSRQDLQTIEHGIKYAARVLEVRFFIADLFQRSQENGNQK